MVSQGDAAVAGAGVAGQAAVHQDGPMVEATSSFRLPSQRDVVAWVGALAEEIMRAPTTLREARLVLSELSTLPDQLSEFGAVLDRTTVALDKALSSLSDAVTGPMHDTLVHLDSAVTELRDTLTALIGSIPGARRALQGVGRLSPPRDVP